MIHVQLIVAVIAALFCGCQPMEQVPRLTVHDATAEHRAIPVFAEWELHEVHLDGERVGYLRYHAADGKVDFEYAPGRIVDLGTTDAKPKGPCDRVLKVYHRMKYGSFSDSEVHELHAGSRFLGLLALHRIGELRLRFTPAASGGAMTDLYPLLETIR